ncbi:hypothetical protein AHF37_09235 [Paragonimus kellicotti]|nr:hypothetical protein AHF37_09235 [Paragonimus kellicotti]
MFVRAIEALLGLLVLGMTSAQPKSDIKWFHWHTDGKTGYDIISNFKSPLFGHFMNTDNVNPLFVKSNIWDSPSWMNSMDKPLSFGSNWDKSRFDLKLIDDDIELIRSVPPASHGLHGSSQFHFTHIPQGSLNRASSPSSSDQQEPKNKVVGHAITYTVAKESTTRDGKTKTDEYGTVKDENFEDKVTPTFQTPTFFQPWYTPFHAPNYHIPLINHHDFGFPQYNFFGPGGGGLYGFPAWF